MKIGILGAGKIGTTLKRMLEQMKVTVVTGDLKDADEFVDAADSSQIRLFIQTNNLNAIVSALPFQFNKVVAAICIGEQISYFDFTEDTDTTDHIQALCENFNMGMSFVPQCGLAPGAINILGTGLIEKFDTVDKLELRVGALPQSSNNEMKYYLSWSSAGLINEYLQPCDALYQGAHIKTMPLEGYETLVIDGKQYEAFNTSGGVATMCESFRGQIKELNYKTIRYPGHRDHMNFLIKDLGLGDRPQLLTEIFDAAVPQTSQDIVILYVNAVGEKDGKQIQKNYTKIVKALDGFASTAIQSTTAAGMAAVIELWIKGLLPTGFVKQEKIDHVDFLATKWGKKIYG